MLALKKITKHLIIEKILQYKLIIQIIFN